MNKIKIYLSVLFAVFYLSANSQSFFWSHNKKSGFTVKYGALYNWYAATDARNITSSDDWVVPTRTQFDVLVLYAGGTSIAGKKLKKIERSGTNDYEFNGELGGIRQQTSYVFTSLLTFGFILTSNSTLNLMRFSNTDEVFWSIGGNKAQGASIRLLYTGAGTPTSYTGNDGKVYRVVAIGTSPVQYWLADNLCETKFRNGDVIPWYGANPANFFTDAEWAALTTAGVCAYDNNLSNVANVFSFP